jgi:hypothetical protein
MSNGYQTENPSHHPARLSLRSSLSRWPSFLSLTPFPLRSQPSFLLKSYLSAPSKIFIPSLSTSEDFPARLKIFINVCHHPNVLSPPSPPPGDGKSVDPWIPGSVGDVSVTVDKGRWMSFANQTSYKS